MLKHFIVDPDCPKLNSMGWSRDQKNNINEMYQLIQKLYHEYSGEVSIVFDSIVNKQENVYNIVGSTVPPKIYNGIEWSQDIEGTITSYIEKYGVSLSNIDNCKLKICVWHNHYSGTGFSAADMMLIVDFFPVVYEAYLDVNFIHRLVPSGKLKDKLKDEVFRSNFLYDLKKIHEGFKNKEFRDQLEELDRTYGSDLYNYFIEKDKSVKEDSKTYKNELYEAARVLYNEKFKSIKENYRNKLEMSEVNATAYFEIIKFAKKEKN